MPKRNYTQEQIINSLREAEVLLSTITGRCSMHPELIKAGAFFVALPMIVLFLAGQKYLIKGLLSGALKE